MDIKTVLSWGTIAVAAAMSLVQIAPIKINPWSWLAKKIGRAINGEVIEKVDKLNIEVAEIRTQQDEHSAKDSRMRILRFGDELLHGENHSKDHFDQILDDVNRYEVYCNEHPNFVNNMTRMTIAQIKSEYQARLSANTFL